MDVSPRKRKIEKMEEEDRISQLPDEILQRIISLIDIEEAVETSLLSTRWKNLWLIWFSLSDVDLDFNFNRLALRRRSNLRDWKAIEDFFNRFARFVEQFLSHRDHNSTIRKFSLSLDFGYRRVFGEESHAAFVERCVDHAINHGVQVLHIHGLCSRALKFPEAFSACETVRELELRPFLNEMYVPKWFSSPHVKTIYIENADFTVDEHEYYDYVIPLWKDSFSRFPSLEKLTLNGCRSEWLLLKCPKLRYLEIINDNEEMVGVSYICTPQLTCFSYQGNKPLQCGGADFPMLEEAYLNLFHRYDILIKGEMSPSKCKWLLEQLGNEKILTLSLAISNVKGRVAIEKSLKGSRRELEFPTVMQRVMFQEYLTDDWSVDIELPEGVSVVAEEYSFPDLHPDNGVDIPLIQSLFQIQDEEKFSISS